MIIFNLWGSLRAVTEEAFDRHFCSGPILPDNTIMVMLMRMMMIHMIMMIIVLIPKNMMMMMMMMIMLMDLSLFLK